MRSLPSTPDVNLDGIVAAEEKAAAVAAAWAAGLNLPPIVPNAFIQANADGSAYQTRTPAQVRTSLHSIPFTEVPFVEAWNNNVPGDGTDQTARLQAIIDKLPNGHGNILLKGDVRVTALNLQSKHNIRIMGLGGLGTGMTQNTMLRTNVGAIGGGRVIDARDSFNVSFERIWLEAIDKTTFNGTLLDYGMITTGASYMHLTDCLLICDSSAAGARGMNIYGATQGSYKDVAFLGKAASGLVSMQQVSGVGFCNVHNFQSCHFKGTNGNYPVQGSGEGLTFQSCNIQAGADGLGRFWQASLSQDFRGVNILGCTFYDPLAAGNEWIAAYRGNGLNVIGCRFGGRGDLGYAAAIRLAGTTGGVHGVTILGNNFEYCNPAISFAGNIAAGTHAREILVASNYLYGTTPNLFGSAILSERLTIFPNHIQGFPNALGAHFNLLYAIPTASTGLGHGDIYSNAGVLTMVT
jgi:hypothetical protein